MNQDHPTKTLIAGANGFIGSALTRKLWKGGRDVAVIAQNPSSARAHFENIEIDYIRANLAEPRSLHRALRGVETVISCLPAVRGGGNGHVADVRHLVEAARKAGVRRFIYLNLACESWHSTNLAAELAVIESGIPYTIFRPSMIFGREDESLNSFVRLAETLPFVPVAGDGSIRVQPLFVMDFVHMLSASIDDPKAKNQVFEIAGPDTMSLDELAGVVLEVLGKRKTIVHHPKWLARAAALPLKLLFGRDTARSTVGIETHEGLMDATKATRVFGIRMTPFRRALETYLSPSVG